MKTNVYALRAEIWPYHGKAAWHFITLSKKQAADIKKRFGANARGWRSLPVTVTIGTTRWLTSIFPDSSSGSYLLPVKASVRKKEKLMDGKSISFTLEVVV
ncbi:MAG: DUF1905 domain-containing protein [Patescibacteria group bacterium]|jgi:hypothetical protein